MQHISDDACTLVHGNIVIVRLCYLRGEGASLPDDENRCAAPQYLSAIGCCLELAQRLWMHLSGFSPLFGEDAWKSDKPDHERGIKILGAPFGTPAYLQQFFNRSLDTEAQLLNFLLKRPSLQSSWLLLYFCAVPRINFFLRTVPPDLVQPLAQWIGML